LTATALTKDLRAALAAQLSEDGERWLTGAQAQIAANPAAVRSLFPAAGRRCGRGRLSAQERWAGWTIDDAARTVLLAALSGPALAAEAMEVYRYGDAAEKRGALRALALLDLGPEALPMVRDALRTSDTRLVAAALGPYGAQHLDGEAYRHGVLKCAFMGVPLAGIAGLGTRRDAELVRMFRAYADERAAAGREVPDDVRRLIDTSVHQG
jgi:hypothetical protein